MTVPTRGPAISSQRLVAALEHLGALGAHDGHHSLSGKINEELHKLSSEQFYLVVLGQFKRGKTTFINALLGEEILPVGVIPVTAVITLIRYGSEKSIEVVFNDQRRNRISPSQLPEYVTEEGNPLNHKQVRLVEIAYPSPLLRQGLVLVDTPGVGSVFLHNTKATQEFIPKVDAAIFVLSVDPPITQAEYDFLKEIGRHVNRFFFVLNKADLLNKEDLEKAASYTQRILGRQWKDGSVAVYPVSARKALDGKRLNNRSLLEESNMRALETSIESFLQTEKSDVFLSRSASRTRHLLAEARFEYELQLNATRTPLLDLQEKIGLFEQNIAALRKDRELMSHLLKGELAAIDRWTDEQMEGFERKERGLLEQFMDDWIPQELPHSRKNIPERADEQLAGRFIADLENWRAQHEPELVRRYQEIVDRYTDKINEFISAVLRAAGELFDVRLQEFSRIEKLTWQRTFYYRLSRERLFFQFDFLKLGLLFLPAAVLRPLLFKRLIRAAGEMVTRNCNNLKYEYTYSMQESFRKLQFDLNDRMDRLIGEISTILRKATDQKDRTVSTSAMLVAALERKARTIEQLENEL